MPIRFQVDPDFYDHPKTIGMSDGATALWVRAGSYSAAKLSDGFIAENALSLLSRRPAEAASELVERGLWRRVKGGYRFHEWDRRNLSRARVESDRKADRERKRAERKPHGQIAKPQVEAPIVQPESAPESARSPNGVRLLSVSVSESVSGSGPNGSAPPTKCADHASVPKPPPCGACADARKHHDEWQADKRRRVALAAKCRVHRGQLAANCALCRAEELSPP